MIQKRMNEREMLECLQAVWENMSWYKDREACEEMLVLLEDMVYLLRYEMGCGYPSRSFEIPKEGTFTF